MTTQNRKPTPAQRARARQDAAFTAPPRRITPSKTSAARVVLHGKGRDWDVSAAVQADTAWELTMEGAATITLPILSPDASLLRLITDERMLRTDGVRTTIDGVIYVVAGASSDGSDLYTLTLEDEVAWRLRQFDRFVAASRETTTRAGFARRLVDEAQRRPLARMRAFIPEVRDVQPIARSTPP